MSRECGAASTHGSRLPNPIAYMPRRHGRIEGMVSFNLVVGDFADLVLHHAHLPPKLLAPLCPSIWIRSRDYDSSMGHGYCNRREREDWRRGRAGDALTHPWTNFSPRGGDHGITQQKFAIEPTVESRASRQ